MPSRAEEARRHKPDKGVTAGQRRHHERLSLALLPGEVLRGDDVEGGVDDVEQASPAAAPGQRPERLQRQIVGLIDTGKRIGVAVALPRLPPARPRRPEEGAAALRDQREANARDLMMRWFAAVLETRLVESDDPVNNLTPTAGSKASGRKKPSQININPARLCVWRGFAF